MEVKWPGSVHDARVYTNSSVNKIPVSKKLPLHFHELVPGFAPVPPILLGDPAIPCIIMKEYPSCSKSEKR